MLQLALLRRELHGAPIPRPPSPRRLQHLPLNHIESSLDLSQLIVVGEYPIHPYYTILMTTSGSVLFTPLTPSPPRFPSEDIYHEPQPYPPKLLAAAHTAVTLNEGIVHQVLFWRGANTLVMEARRGGSRVWVEEVPDGEVEVCWREAADGVVYVHSAGGVYRISYDGVNGDDEGVGAAEGWGRCRVFGTHLDPGGARVDVLRLDAARLEAARRELRQSAVPSEWVVAEEVHESGFVYETQGKRVPGRYRGEPMVAFGARAEREGAQGYVCAVLRAGEEVSVAHGWKVKAPLKALWLMMPKLGKLGMGVYRRHGRGCCEEGNSIKVLEIYREGDEPGQVALPENGVIVLPWQDVTADT